MEKTFAHETAGHKGLQVLLGNEYTSIIDEIYSAVNQKHSADLQELAATYGQDLNTIEGQRYIIEEYLANQADLKQLSGFKSFVQKIKLALRKVGFRAKWTDDEIATLMRRSLENVRKQRSPQTGTGNGVRFMADEELKLLKGNFAKKFSDITQAIRMLYQKSIYGFKGQNDSFVDYAKITNEEKSFLEQQTSLDLSGIKYHAIDVSGMRHMENQHGINGKRINQYPNQIPITENDYTLIPYIVKSKNVSYAGKDSQGQDLIKYEYKNGDTYYYLEEVRTGREKLSGKTFYKIGGTPVTPAQQNNTAQLLYTRATNNNLSPNPEKSSGNQEKMRFSIAPQVDTPAFKNWFKDSKVVDENGNPLVAYHGSSADFTAFSHEFAMRNGADDGRGFYFTSDRSKAEGYKTKAGKLFEVYLSLQKPLNPNELTITKNEIEKIIRAIDVDGDYVSNYAESDKGYPGKAWFDKAVKRAATMIYESSEGNADIVAEIYSLFGQGDALAKITEAVGYDGFIRDDVFVVFNPTQIKSATDNVGTFDPDNPDIRFSISPVDGDGFVSTADREKMITVLMGIPQQQLDNMDGAAALDYLTQKQFKVPSDDMAQSLLNNARHRRKEIIKQFADKRRKDWIMDNYPFYRALVELGGENAKVLLPKGELYKNYSGSFFARGKLKNGTAVPLKDIVDKIQASGTDTKNIESKVLKFFDGLNISKLQQAYRDSMFDPASKTVQEHENYLLNKLSENKIFSEKEAAELQTLKEKYNALGLDLNIDNINIDTARPAQTAEKLEPVTNLSADQKQQLAAV